MIKLITGAIRCGSEIKRPADKAFSLSEEEEKFLVEREVAVYVSEEQGVEDVAKPDESPMEDGAGVNLSEDKKPEEGEKTPDRWSELSHEQIKVHAIELGIDIKGMRKKADIIAAIKNVYEESSTVVLDGEPLPELGVEDPVE